ncbi:hypothetical protein [Kitasatospora sp. NBC_01302]|uniref:hypothetical protein n=1 Tax=Kitasatospora sp. NBC_01302 TaxID=2903575 RepID=UPI002E13C825|nr:hypothetical protein OG294_36135 [Kitasatospora sp. NBC_01302]
MPSQDHATHSVLHHSVIDTLRAAGYPFAGGGGVGEGVAVSCGKHGVTVSWKAGARGGQPGPGVRGGATTGRIRVHGSAAVRSEGFLLALRLATTLAEAGYQSDHLGDRVLVSDAALTAPR